MTVLGQFRDLDDPDRFVWLRSFADMAVRKDALTRFYGGPVWRAHREQANATMIDSDDVLLLRPVGDDLVVPDRDGRPAGLIVASMEPDSAGVEIARLCTEHAENTFPALPVRTDVDVEVRLARVDRAAPGPHRLRLAPTERSRLR
jgi:hypothetical protein